MTSKIYEKSDLKFRAGYIINEDDEIINVSNRIVSFFNNIDTMAQACEFIKKNPMKKSEKLTEFKRQHTFDPIEFDMPGTPLIDEQVKKTMSMLDEINKLDVTKKANEFLNRYDYELRFIKNSFIIDDCDTVVARRMKFDLFNIESPLSLTLDGAMKIIGDFFKMCSENQHDPRIKSIIDTIW